MTDKNINLGVKVMRDNRMTANISKSVSKSQSIKLNLIKYKIRRLR